MDVIKKILLIALLGVIAFAAYHTYRQWQQDTARLEQDARMIADMLKQQQPKE
ncbi:MAG: hypothetical protein N3B18_05410 [Desulfobacterota bacterium]|nr:hypothetical protein [Thermodesulfobacteriota bacterium]